MQCTVEVLSIGNELLLGNTVNTNASWIASRVTNLGGKVTRITTIGDSLNDISQSVREALRRNPDFLITTGGIGPTFDDMSVKGVARALGLRISLDKTAVAMLRAHYARRFPNRRIPLTKPRLKMASIPATSVPVLNPVGTAPGVRLIANATEIFCLPGVPSEAKAIFHNTVKEAIKARSKGAIFEEKWFKVFGITESSIAPVVSSIMHRWRGIYIKSHPRGIDANGRPKIELHLSIASEKPREARLMVLKAATETRKRLTALGAQVIP
jgi:nicotinamide-nucleotide amidase